jgi:hypothetical protein
MNTSSRKVMRRGIGVALLTGAATVLISLAAAGSAAADPTTPGIPINPAGPVFVSRTHLGDVSLNPQPLPPRIFNPGGPVELNPQPLPPRIERIPSWVELNPQPLPPGPPDPFFSRFLAGS